MRLVALTAPFLNVALYLVGTTELVSSLPADSSDTITLRKCVDFMGGYAGSWFAKDAMFKDVKWPDRAALEFATRDLYNDAHKKSGSGYKTNRAVTDWMVMHLSGIEHHFVRTQGYLKGLALTNKTSSNALQIVLKRHTVDSEAPHSLSISELKRRSIAVVPFYGGVAKVQLDPTNGRVVNQTLPAGAGNSHTLATVPLKLLQLSATVASVQRFFGTVVVGVVSEAEAKLVQDGLARHLPPSMLASNVFRVQIIPCGDMSVYLPYRLLRWVQSMHAANGLIVEPTYAADTSTDIDNNVKRGVDIPEGASASPPSRRRRHLRISDDYITAAATNSRAKLDPETAPISRSPRKQGRRLTNVLGMKGHHHHHKHKGSGSSSGSGGDGNNEPGVEVVESTQRQPFDLVYYTEADNVLLELNREAMARALLAFANAFDLGERSYVAPNRLEGELLNGFHVDMPHAEMVKYFKPVGQNNCEDDRGDLEVFGPDGSRSTVKGTPH